MDEIENYLRDSAEGTIVDASEYFYDNIPLELYGERLKTEIALGPPKNVSGDEEDADALFSPCETHSIRDYCMFSYPDYMSEEYEAELLRGAADPYMYSVDELKSDAVEIVVLETEG